MKGKDWLLVGAAALIGYMIYKGATKDEDEGNGFGSFFEGIPSSITSITMPEIKIPQVQIPDLIPDLPDLVPDLPSLVGQAVAGIPAKTAAQATAIVAPKVVPAITPPIVSKLFPKVALGGLKVLGRALPVVGWGWLAADLGVTIYEKITGQDIAGDWLGWNF